MPDVVAPEAHQNNRSYVSEFSKPHSPIKNMQIFLWGNGYTEDLKNQQNCQNWAVGACVGMGASPGQCGIWVIPCQINAK